MANEIRRGVRFDPKPNIRPSMHEVELRVCQVLKWMRAFRHRSDIKRLAKARWDVDWRTADNYIAKARARLMAEASRTKEEMHARLTDKLEEIIADENTKARDKIRACHELALIHALNTYSVRVTVGSPDDDLDERRRRVAEQLEQLRLAEYEDPNVIDGQVVQPEQEPVEANLPPEDPEDRFREIFGE